MTSGTCCSGSGGPHAGLEGQGLQGLAGLKAREAVGAEECVGVREGDAGLDPGAGSRWRRELGAKNPTQLVDQPGLEGLGTAEKSPDPDGFLGGESVVHEDHGETMFSRLWWRSRP